MHIHNFCFSYVAGRMAPQHLYPESAKSQDWRDQKWLRLRSMYHKAVRGGPGGPAGSSRHPRGIPRDPQWSQRGPCDNAHLQRLKRCLYYISRVQPEELHRLEESAASAFGMAEGLQGCRYHYPLPPVPLCRRSISHQPSLMVLLSIRHYLCAEARAGRC